MRASGVLMHISSLPSDYGIGTLGKEAYSFVDFLQKAGQIYWQVLPLCPTGYGDSPYQSFSAFAGNPYFIDLTLLTEQGLLRQEDYNKTFWGNSITEIDYSALYQNRFKVLRIAFTEFCKGLHTRDIIALAFSLGKSKPASSSECLFLTDSESIEN